MSKTSQKTMDWWRQIETISTRTATEEDGYDEDDHTQLLVAYNKEGEETVIASDDMEPEDATFYRDLSWVQERMQELLDTVHSNVQV